jgi:hypothetical protein
MVYLQTMSEDEGNLDLAAGLTWIQTHQTAQPAMADADAPLVSASVIHGLPQLPGLRRC